MDDAMKVLCTICARGGSVGVKNKNIRKLRGKPLISHSIIQAKKTNLFDFVAISSDSKKILDTAKQWGADHLITRPAELATSVSPKHPVIQHAVLETERFYGEKFDIIIDLDATSPLRSVDDIIAAFKMFIDHKEAINLVTASSARRSPYFNMLEVSCDGYAKLVKTPEEKVTRRQDSPACYDMNASIYIWKRDALFNSQSVFTDRTLLYVMPEDRSIDIDSLLDWKFVSLLAKNRKDM